MTESVTIYPTPIPKNWELPLMKGSEEAKEYDRHLQLYLGSLVSFILEGNESPMPNFVNHLNCLSTNLGDRICEQLKAARREFEKIFSGREIMWFTEVSFTPSPQQIERIKNLLDHFKSINIAKSNGYQDLGLLIRDILLGRKSEIIIGDETINAKNLFLEAMANKHPEKKESDTDMLTELLRYIISYYYFDFVGTKEPPRFSRIIASASARIDMFGLEPGKNKEGAVDKDAEQLITEIKNKNVFNHFMLDLTSLTNEEISLIRQLLEYIASGRVRVVFVEIKSQLTNTDLQDREVVFKPEEVLEAQYQDVAHSLMAMFQFLTRAANLPGTPKIEGFGDLIDLMRPNIEKRREAFFHYDDVL